MHIALLQIRDGSGQLWLSKCERHDHAFGKRVYNSGTLHALFKSDETISGKGFRAFIKGKINISQEYGQWD